MRWGGGYLGGTLYTSVKMAAVTRPKGPQGFKGGTYLRSKLLPGLGLALPLGSKSKGDSRQETMPNSKAAGACMLFTKSTRETN